MITLRIFILNLSGTDPRRISPTPMSQKYMVTPDEHRIYSLIYSIMKIIIIHKGDLR